MISRHHLLSHHSIASATGLSRLAVFGLALCVTVQGFLGAAVANIVMCVAAGLIGLVPVRLYGPSHTVGSLFIWVSFAYAFNALVVKTLLLQPIDSNLFVPSLSFTVVLVGMLASVLGAVAAYPLCRRKTGILPSFRNYNEARRVGLLCISAGAFAQWQESLSTGTGQSVFGFVGPVLYLGIACTTFAVIGSSAGRRVISSELAVTFVIVLILSFARNAKTALLLSVASYVVSVVAFAGRQAFVKVVATASVIMLPLELVVTPAVHQIRDTRESLSSTQSVIRTAEVAAGILLGDKGVVAALKARSERFESGDPLLYRFVYLRASTGDMGSLERFMLLPYADAALRRTGWNTDGIGLDNISGRLLDFLPGIFPIEKQYEDQTNILMWRLGLLPQGVRGFITTPLPAELYIYGGFVAVIFLTSITYFCVCLLLSNLSSDLRRSPFAIFLLVVGGGYVISSVFSTIQVILFRLIPSTLMVAIIILFVLRFFDTRRAPRIMRTAMRSGPLRTGARKTAGLPQAPAKPLD